MIIDTLIDEIDHNSKEYYATVRFIYNNKTHILSYKDKSKDYCYNDTKEYRKVLYSFIKKNL
jgi:hypothetical protein